MVLRLQTSLYCLTATCNLLSQKTVFRAFVMIFTIHLKAVRAQQDEAQKRTADRIRNLGRFRLRVISENESYILEKIESEEKIVTKSMKSDSLPSFPIQPLS